MDIEKNEGVKKIRNNFLPGNNTDVFYNGTESVN